MIPAQKILQDAEGSVPNLRSVWRYRGMTLLAADFVFVTACFLIAFYIRAELQPLLEEHLGRHVAVKNIAWDKAGAYLNTALLLAAMWVFLIWREGGYESGLRGIASPLVRMKLVLTAGVKAFAVVLVISYMYHGSFLSRPVYVMTGVFSLSSMILVRLLFLTLDRDMAAQGLGLQYVVVAGLDDQTEDFARRLTNVGSTVQIAGFLHANGDSPPPIFADWPILGSIDDLSDIYDRQPFDKLIVSQRLLSGDQGRGNDARMIEIVNFCEAHAISLYTLPRAMSVAVAQNEVGSFSGVPLVRLRDASLRAGYAAVKRCMDIFIASMVLVLGLPLWAGIAVIIKLAGKGPVIFTHTRVGLHGQQFKMYKFRSMVQDAEAQLKDLVNIEKLDVPGFKLSGDPRVTRVGRFLRRTSLDEIPQLLNVLKGEMSLVGPRPEMPQLVDRYDPWQRRRLKAKPGITGYQQIVARGQPLAGAIHHDLIYLKHQSFLLDVYIMLKTIVVVLRGSGVTH